MNFNDSMDRALSQARDMQRQIGDAAANAAEQLKPQVQQSLESARELQQTFAKHATESNEIAAKQMQTAMSMLGDFIRMGGEAMRESAEQSRAIAAKMVDQSKKVVEAADAMAKERA